MRAALRSAMPLLAAAAVAGCSAPQNDALFPLAEGHAWTYRVTTKYEDESYATARETITLRTRGAEDIDGKPAWRRLSDSGVEYWLRADETGIYRVASRSPIERKPRPDSVPRYVLKAPVAPGTEWEADTIPYILFRRNEVPHELRYAVKPFPMKYRVDALDQTVETPAGRFDGCVRVTGQAVVKMFNDPQLDFRERPLTSKEWYCRGVGLVRLERTEQAPSKFMVGGVVTMELQSWK